MIFKSPATVVLVARFKFEVNDVCIGNNSVVSLLDLCMYCHSTVQCMDDKG